jgi:hypothetical protein
MEETHMPRHRTWPVIAATAVVLGSGGAVHATTPPEGTPVIDPGDGGNYAPAIDAANFVDSVDNPYFPLVPGTRWVYEGTSEGEVERTEVEVLDERREIEGISAVVVRDTVYIDDEMVEDTHDWFAQDSEGNVWYLGEDSHEYENGQDVGTSGSWEYGVDGALPGIVMPAEPAVGDAYRQEYYPGEAEDMGEILEVGISHSIALGDYDDVVVTEDWNPLEPDVVEHKWYARDVGMIAEAAVAGGDERAELVEFAPGG